MIEDTMEVLDEDNIEEEAEEEVDKIIFDLTNGKICFYSLGLLGQGGKVGRDLNVIYKILILKGKYRAWKWNWWYGSKIICIEILKC